MTASGDLSQTNLIQFENVEDPEERGQLYFEKHQLLHVFQELAAAIATEKPNDPREFMVNKINRLIYQRESEILKDTPIDIPEDSESLVYESQDSLVSQPVSQPKFYIEHLYEAADEPSCQNYESDENDSVTENESGIKIIVTSDP